MCGGGHLWGVTCEELHFPVSVRNFPPAGPLWRLSLEWKDTPGGGMRAESTLLHSDFTICLRPRQPNSSDGVSRFSENFASNFVALAFAQHRKVNKYFASHQ